MISFSLKCGQGHVFEAWFRNSNTFDAQAAAGEVACPECGGTTVEKAPMAPRLVKALGDGAERAAVAATELRRALGSLRRQVEEKCDYVGPAFSEEARKIHYGEASRQDADALREEGIDVATIPWLDREDA